MTKSMLDNRSHLILRVGLGLVALLAGLTKIFNLINWDSYLSPLFSSLIPFSISTFMILAGIAETLVGILLLSKKFTKYGAILACVWLVSIIINLLTIGAYDIVLRDLGLFAMALALALN